MEAVITVNGTLNIDAKYCKHAIKSKGNLTVNAGNINVTSAPNKAVFARNEMTINDGKMDFSGVKNGMECSGNITVHGGIIIVNSTGDCIKAAPDDDDETAALPGAKDNLLTINGGSLNLTSTADDGMICAGNMNINGGEVTISAISKGIKAVGDFNVTGGKVDIVMDANTTGNEAIESKQKIHIKDGEFYIISNGDGINTAVEDGLTVTDASEYNEIVIDGGTFSICSNTDDGIDGNGNITINGGTFDLSGYSKGIVSHGIFTINDGKIVVDMILDGDSSGQTTTDPWNNMGG